MMGWHHGVWPLYSRSERWAERRAGVANGAVVVPGSAGLLRRVVGAAEMAVGGLVIFVRRQVVEPYAEVIADPGEAAGQQVGVARDAGQILLES
jgi:hypothetical protein